MFFSASYFLFPISILAVLLASTSIHLPRVHSLSFLNFQFLTFAFVQSSATYLSRFFSIGIAPNGFAWLVIKPDQSHAIGKILVWKAYSPGPVYRSDLGFYELRGASPRGGVDFIPNADCICSFSLSGLLVVTSSGVVTVWMDVASDPSASCVLKNFAASSDEVVSVTACEPVGYVVGTRTGLLYLIIVQVGDGGEITLSTQLVTEPQGVLGWGASLLGFGSRAAEGSILRILCTGNDSTSSVVTVLSKTTFQRWSFYNSRNPVLRTSLPIFESNGTVIEPGLAGLLSDRGLTGSSAELLDMWSSADRLVLLVVIFPENEKAEDPVRYLLGFSNNDSTFEWHTTPYSTPFAPHERSADSAFKLLVPTDSYRQLYMVNTDDGRVIPTRGDGRDDRQLMLPDLGLGNRPLLGAAVVNGSDCLFISERSLLRITQKDLRSIDDAQGHVKRIKGDGDGGPAAWLSMAFDRFCDGDNDGAREYFRQLSASAIDVPVTNLSTSLIDGNVPDRVKQTNSLIILRQLESKRQRHAQLVDFLLWEALQESSERLWSRLSSDCRRGIANHGGKVAASIVLRTFQRSSRCCQEVIDDAVAMIVDKADVTGHECADDVFYENVSQVAKILPCIVSEQFRRMTTEMTGPDREQVLLALVLFMPLCSCDSF